MGIRYTIIFLLSFLSIEISSQDRMDTAINIGTRSEDFAYSHTLHTSNGYDNYYGWDGNELYYKVTITEPMILTISHCGSELAGSTSTLLLDSRGNILGEDDNDQLEISDCAEEFVTYLRSEPLSPGTYYIISEATIDWMQGNITTTVTGTTKLGTVISVNPLYLPADYTFIHTQQTGICSNLLGKPTNEVYYRFNIREPMRVVISHCGSKALGQDPYKTVIYLQEFSANAIASGNYIASSEGDNEFASTGGCSGSQHNNLTVRVLPPGGYRVICEGSDHDGDITTTIQTFQADVNLSKEQNYILTSTFLDEKQEKALDNIQYFDGLGRPVQTIQVGASHKKADLVTYQEYDAYGRESNVWLPAVVNSPKGTYVSESTIKSNSISSNGGDTKPYSTPIYEASPLNRVVEQYGPGQAWHQDYSLAKGKAIRTYYMTNKGGSKIARPTIDLADNRTLSGAYGACQTITLKDKFHFKADDEKSLHLYIDPSLCQVATPMAINTTNAPASTLRDEFLQCTIYKVGTNAVIKSDDYKTGELYVTLIIDEDGNQSLEFKDKLGQVVLTRQVNGSEKYDTYYVYDDFGNLRYVLPPLAVDRLTNFTDEDPIMQQFAYIYKYDHRNRCIWKKLPGAKHILYVYDKADQLIFTQDGEQRNRKTNGRSEWTFNKYDAFGRLIISGIYQTADTLEALATKYEKIVVKENVGSGSYGYTWYHLTESEIDIKKHVLLVNYYDNYNNFPKMWDYPQVLVYKNEQDYGTKYNNAKGLLIGTRVKHFKPTGETEYSRAGETATTYFYDTRGRVIQTHSTNHLGGTDSEYIAYNFTGQPIKKKHVHTANNSTQTEVYDYTYDHALRLTETKHNGTVIAFNTYDELGRLISNKKGNNAYLDTKYNYNIRSWTTSMKSSHLHINLDYTYGGNIKSQAWTQEGKQRKYTFAYDGLSRLLSAQYSSPVSGEKYGVSYTYDKHGNIATLKREGKTGANAYGLVDNLSMAYTGNQLIRINDAINTPSIAGSADFINYGGANAQMTYNLNGALAKDMHKGISSIQYNSLNLPQSMAIDNGLNARGNIAYTYTASGVKLQTIHTEDENIANMPIMGTGTFASVNPKVTTTDYVGNKIYEKVGNDARKLKRILIDGGYIEGGAYHYYLTDHLGNNRAVANAGGNIIQRTQYYPFGMAFADKLGEQLQPYKYNGKELDTRLQLNTYDYSARYMDPAIGRFTSVDPLAEKYYSWSPYVYALNNPTKFIDPDGRNPIIPVLLLTAYLVLKPQPVNAPTGDPNDHRMQEAWDDYNTGLATDLLPGPPGKGQVATSFGKQFLKEGGKQVEKQVRKEVGKEVKEQVSNTFENVTNKTNKKSNKGSTVNYETDATRSEVEKTLKESGYKETSKGGKNNVTVYEKRGSKTKVIRDNASSTGGSTLDILNDKNKPTQKIRLGNE